MVYRLLYHPSWNYVEQCDQQRDLGECVNIADRNVAVVDALRVVLQDGMLRYDNPS